ncbi:CHAD domain-containing protein [Nocardia sp. AG03]|uniref:CHAD domain-containing protein n=1 Tax=Nocardia sp. AG03 TaxID=3025312 RepID=UPI00241886E0|nr:CHAD domain-containing protein [Nocardia sp. AG03]
MATTAATALRDALREDIDRLLAAEPDVRADADDSVHQMRVATRRLRSVLRSYRALFTGDHSKTTARELKWLADILGVARDAEVRAARFKNLLRDHDDVPVEVIRALVGASRHVYATGHSEVLTTLDGDRYRRLADTLTDWRTDPPLTTDAADTDAASAFERVLRRDRKRLRALVLAEPTAAPADRVELLHDIRKGAKRLRYSCEAASEVLGDAAADLGTRAKRLQTVLGDHRDAVESREAIQAAAAELAPTGATLFELLADAEEVAAGQALARYPAAAAFVTGTP